MKNNIENKSIFAAIQNIKEKGLTNVSPQLFKSQVLAVYLGWRLENFSQHEITITDYNNKTGVLTYEDDLFNNTDTININALYDVWGDPQLIAIIGNFEAPAPDNCFGTLIDNLHETHPYELSIAVCFALHYKYLIRTFNKNFGHVLSYFNSQAQTA